MRTNPFSDTFSFFMQEYSGRFWNWPIKVLVLLLVASILVAAYCYVRNSEQRSPQHVWGWVARLFIGGLWWQQTLWKLPPTYTDNPDGTSGGLHYWVGEMVNNAAFGFQSNFVRDVVQPHFNFFAAQVYAVEVFISASLLLGLFTRLGGLLGALMGINLWLGLYRASYEWPWTYFFLIVIQVSFAVLRVGRSLGIDGILAQRWEGDGKPKGPVRVLSWLT